MDATANMVDWIKHRTRVQLLLSFLFCICIGASLALIIGRTQPTYWIVFGGNTDPGDGNCGGQAHDQYVSGGWVGGGSICQIQWKADITQDTAQEANDAMPAAHDVWNAHCGGGNCVISGFSLGNSPALQLASEVGAAPGNIRLFGAPQPSTGVFHHYAPDNPTVNPWIIEMGGLKMDRPVPAGAQAYYGSGDPYADAAPQCTGPGLFALNIPAHRIITVDESNQHVWTGPDGVVMHEADYVTPPGLPRSGSDPSQPFDGCPASGWYNQPGEVPAPAPGGTGPTGPAPSIGNVPPPQPAAPNPQPPGVFQPNVPSAPGGVPGFPSAPSGMPGAPSLPGFPPVPGFPPPPGG